VMLSGRHALVTDFGVAKAVSEATGRQTLTTAGVALGTPAYMAPEQAAADPHTDHRADIYAFGVVAYELLTGRPPFTGASPQAILAAHVTTAADPVTKFRASIPPSLAALVMRCLKKKPADRWQSADELIPALEAVLTPSGGMTPTYTQPVSPLRQRRPRLVTVGVVALLVVAGAAGAVWLVTRGRGPDLVKNRVVVAPFANATGDSTLAPIGGMAANWIERGLIETNALQVVSAPASIAAESTTALLTFATQAGASLLVSGAYYATPDSIRFEAKLTDVAKGSLLSALDPMSSAKAEPTFGIDRLRKRLMSGAYLALGLDSGWTGEAGRTTAPPIFEAYQVSLQADEAFRKGDMPARRELRHRAAALDSTFWVTRLDAVYSDMGVADAEADTELRAIEASRGQLTAVERAVAEAARGMLDGDNRRAHDGFRRYADIAPTGTALTNLASTALVLDRPTEVVGILTNLDPHRADMKTQELNYWSSLSDAYHLLGRYPQALTAAREGVKSFPNNPNVVSRELVSLAASGQLKALREHLDESSRQPVEGGWSYGYLVFWPGLDLLRHDRPAEAKEFLDRAIAWFEKELSPTELAPFPWGPWGLWWAYRAAGRTTDAMALVERVGIRSFAVTSPLDSLGVLALVAVDRRDTVTARRLRDLILTAPDPRYRTQVELARLYWQAAIATALGDKEQAVQKLREWFQRGGQFWMGEHFNPAFIPLFGYPPYEELLRPKG